MFRGRMGWWCFLFGLILGGAAAVEAADWAALLDLEAKGEYLSNINYSPTNRKSDYILSAKPRLALQYNTEATKLEGNLALAGLHYLSNSSLDRINQYYQVNGSQRLTPRLLFRLGAYLTSDSTLQEELLASGVFINRSLRTAVGANPGLVYNLTERLSTYLDYGFNYTDYQSKDIFYNYRVHSLSQGFDYLWTEKTILKSFLSGSYTSYTIGNTIANLGAQVGLNHNFTENLGLTLMVGANLSRIKSKVSVLAIDDFFGFVTVIQVPRRSTDISPFVALASSYKWPSGNLTLSYSRNQSASAYGNLSQYNIFRLFITQKITERLSSQFNPHLSLSKMDSPGSDYSSTYYGIRSGLSYELTERLSLGAFYGFNYRKVSGSADYGFPIHSAYLILTYSYPIHYQ